jgi:hypothetical protein
MSTLRKSDVLEYGAARSVLGIMPSRQLRTPVTNQAWFELTQQLESRETLYCLFTTELDRDARGYFITRSAHIPDFIEFCAEKAEMGPHEAQRKYMAYYAVQRPQ